MKGRQRVALAKEHNHRFVEPVRSSESGLSLISLLNPNVVISPPDIEFGEILGVFESVNEVRNMRKRVSILDGMRINVVIILARAERSILLQDKEEGGRLRGVHREDLFLLEILINECLEGLHLLWFEQIVLRLTGNK